MLLISTVRPFTFKIFRFSFGLLLSSIGILWSESLSAISGLQEFSNYLITFLENNTSFKIPRIGDISSLHSLNPQESILSAASASAQP